MQPGGPVPTGTTANRRELAVERAAKKDAVEALNGLFKTTGVAIVAHYSGLTVAQKEAALADEAGRRIGEGLEKPSRQNCS